MTTQANITPEQAAQMLATETQPAAVAAPVSANHNGPIGAADVAPQATADEAARAPVPKPEAVAPTTETIMPPPHAEFPTPIQSVGEAQVAHVPRGGNSITFTPQEQAAAVDAPFALEKESERKLAVYLHDHLSPVLSQGISVDVSSSLSKWPTVHEPAMMTLHIDIMGDGVHKKAEDLLARITEELKKHPAFHGLEIGGGYLSKGPDHDLDPQKTLAEMNQVHLVIPNIPVARFKQLLETLAEVKPEVVALAATQHADGADHQCSGAGCNHCNAPAAEAPAVAEATPDANASVAVPEASAALAPTVQGPIHPASQVAAEAQASAAHAVSGAPAAQVVDVNHVGIANDTIPKLQVG